MNGIRLWAKMKCQIDVADVVEEKEGQSGIKILKYNESKFTKAV